MSIPRFILSLYPNYLFLHSDRSVPMSVSMSIFIAIGIWIPVPGSASAFLSVCVSQAILNPYVPLHVHLHWYFRYIGIFCVYICTHLDFHDLHSWSVVEWLRACVTSRFSGRYVHSAGTAESSQALPRISTPITNKDPKQSPQTLGNPKTRTLMQGPPYRLFGRNMSYIWDGHRALRYGLYCAPYYIVS